MQARLSYAIYFLHGLPDVYDLKKYAHLEQYFKNNCSQEERQDTVNSLDEFLKNPDLKSIAIYETIRQSDDEVLFFFKKLKNILQDIEPSNSE